MCRENEALRKKIYNVFDLKDQELNRLSLEYFFKDRVLKLYDFLVFFEFVKFYFSMKLYEYL